ncbi:MAG: hypothetical protein H7177_10425, partial [Rhizobacter sp.]|nr:hypothetical protein [Bacteriovorax sp.]
YYQHSSKLQGSPIENCKNTELSYGNGKTDLFNAHIHAEWDASGRAQLIIQDYLNGKLQVMFLRDQYNIDYRKGL